MQISLNNYESFFLLYVDQELTRTERQKVETFLQLHPELQSEFDALQETILPKQEIFTLLNKEKFLLPITTNTPTLDALLTLLDGESETTEAEKLHLQIGANKTVKETWDELQLAKLPAENIPHPDKESLYKKEHRPLVIPMFLQLGIAAALLVLVATLIYYRIGTPADKSPSFVIQKPEKTLPLQDTFNKTDLNVQRTTAQTKGKNAATQQSIVKNSAEVLTKKALVAEKPFQKVDAALQEIQTQPVPNLLVDNIQNKEAINKEATLVTTNPVSPLSEKITEPGFSLKSLASNKVLPKETDNKPEQAYAVNDDVHILYIKASTLRNTKLGAAFTRVKNTIQKNNPTKINIGKTANAVETL